MAAGPDILEVRHQAQVLLTEHGSPLPGELQVLEDFGKRLEELRGAELEGKKRFGGQVLVNLCLYLMQPGLAEAILGHQPPAANPVITIHSDLYNQVLEHAKALPFRGVSVPLRKGNSLAIWSSHWDAEEQISQAAKAAILGDSLELPTVNLDDCSIKFSPGKGSIWSLQPDGGIWVKHGEYKPRRSHPSLERFSRMIAQATDYLSTRPRS